MAIGRNFQINWPRSVDDAAVTAEPSDSERPELCLQSPIAGDEKFG